MGFDEHTKEGLVFSLPSLFNPLPSSVVGEGKQFDNKKQKVVKTLHTP
jgi:hypothetical protein